MRRLIGGALLAWALLGTATSPARAQWAGTPAPNPAYFAATGSYGMSWGAPSFGSPRTYTSFGSPYGGGYGFGYGPNTFLPGSYGVGLWRPGFASPGYVYGAGFYRALPVPYRPLVPYRAPAVGYYAPWFGPGAAYAY